jgi:hypothetical protein
MPPSTARFQRWPEPSDEKTADLACYKHTRAISTLGFVAAVVCGCSFGRQDQKTPAIKRPNCPDSGSRFLSTGRLS